MKVLHILGVFLLVVLLFGCITIPGQQGGKTGTPENQGQTAAQGQQNQTTGGQPNQTGGNVTPPANPGNAGNVTPPANQTPANQTQNNKTDGTSKLADIKSKEISFKTKDGWQIYATLYYAINSDNVHYPDQVIVLIPQLGMDRSSYDFLVPRLHEEFPNADLVAMDMRGQGKSTNLGSYVNFQTGDYRAMGNDLLALRVYLNAIQPTVSKYYLVGSSIGSSVAIDYGANHNEVAKVVMISPGTAYEGFDISDVAEDYSHGLYIATASDDTYSASSADAIYKKSPASSKELKVYYANKAHGIDLFYTTADTDEPLETLVVEWIRR